MADPVADLTGTTVGRFSVRARLGAGGMGEVYRADDTKLKRSVALKRMAPHLRADARYRQRFLKEAERASGLTDAHIAGLYDVLEESGETFLVMEYVEGETLRQRFQRPLPIAELLEIAGQCAEALVTAHQKGIVHRDLKPENIMLTPAGQVKVLDFGVAKRLPRPDETADTAGVDTQRSTGGLSGTPAYMAPETLLEKEADGRADIFSLGIVLYEALTGRHPFLAGGFMATSDRILHEPPAPLTQLNPRIEPELARMVAKMLAKRPAERYQTAADLLVDLRALERGKRIELRPSPPAPQPWYRRRKVQLAAVAVVAATGLGWWLYHAWVPRPYAERDWVLVADFENRTGESAFDQTLRELLSTTLEQSRYVNVFPASRLPEVLRRMQRAEFSPITPEIGREICQREGLQALVHGSLIRLGANYVLVVMTETPTGETLLSTREVFAEPGQLPATLDRVAKRLRTGLGESLASVEKSSAPLAQVTSPSLEAIRYYSLGRQHLYAGSPREAVVFLKRALELDAQFAMAHEYLGVAYQHLNDLAQAQEHLYRASRLVDRVTEPEKYKILGDYYYVTRNYDRAIDHLQILTQLRPDNAAAHLNLGVCYLRKFQWERARVETEAAVRLQPETGPRNNLAEVYFLQGDIAEALRLTRKILESHPEDARALYNLGRCQLAVGRIAVAEQVFTRLAEKGGNEESQGRVALADVDLATGRYGEARRQLEAGLAANHIQENAYAAVRKQLQLATLFLRQGSRREFDRAMAGVQLPESEPELLLLAGRLYAQARRFPEAERTVRALERLAERNPVPALRSFLELLKAELAMARGEASAAMQAAESAVRYEDSPLAVETLARAYQAAGRLQDAINQFEQVLARRNERSESYDAPAFYQVVETYYWLGILYQNVGEDDRARQHLRSFLSYWTQPDTDLEIYRDARRRLRLTAGSAPRERRAPTPAT